MEFLRPSHPPGSSIPQMFRVPGSKVKYSQEKILQVLHVLAVFGLCVLRDTASTRSISGLNTLDTACTSSIFGFDTVEYCCTSKYLGVRYSGILSVVPRHPALLIL